MGSLQIVPFDDSHLGDAAGLLAARHRRDRTFEPSLREHFTEKVGAQAGVLASWHEGHASGVVALRDGRMAGFLIGSEDLGEIWGRSIWVRYAGHALAQSEDAELYRDLYAAAAPHWLARGCFAHYAEVLADDPASIDAWFRLGFGQQHAYAICPLEAENLPNLPFDPTIIIRRASMDDVETLTELRGILSRHLGRRPVYSVRLPEDAPGWRERAVSDLSDPQVAVWFAEEGGTVLGAVATAPLTADHETLDAPEHCCYFAFAAVREEARGRGLGAALTVHSLREAKREGYRCSFTDWRVTNLPASRLWPRLGFRPFQYRLHRLIDDRIAWSGEFPW